MRRFVVFVGSMFAGVALLTAQAQDHQGHADLTRLGVVTFENSCSKDVQAPLARGMALLHSFEFGPAIEAFTGVAATDPSSLRTTRHSPRRLLAGISALPSSSRAVAPAITRAPTR